MKLFVIIKEIEKAKKNFRLFPHFAWSIDRKSRLKNQFNSDLFLSHVFNYFANGYSQNNAQDFDNRQIK
ncbi:hypothetical protein BpHYR1_041535 [Brachionus plicatilis]|uniref:Uncharacterized protein n=1 Tax=Brachionus plicatilis TaxID=10195 RepID=A0A3M7PVY2_BRAPC|nr:hypothetical protein BpHYR1_041535 [Brachionus plicatilis]